MKRFTMISLMMLANTALFCQMHATGAIERKIDAQNVPYELKPTSSTSRDGAIWRPFICKHYTMNSSQIPYSEGYQKFDQNGILKERGFHLYGDSVYFSKAIYNQTFTKEGFDFRDTLYYYKKEGIPAYRVYHDIHYYDRMPEDSFYTVQYREGWDDTAKEWVKWNRSYIGYFDTILFVVRETSDADFINGEWVQAYGSRVLREYNEDGLVTSLTIQELDIATGEYAMWGKSDYVYNKDGIDSIVYNYLPDGDDWKLDSKSTELQYVEWYPNGQEGIIIEILFEPEEIALSGKRIKKKSFTKWYLNDNDEWEKYATKKSYWDIDGTKSHIDSAFVFLNNDLPYLYYREAHLYDDRDNYIQRWTEFFSSPDIYGNVKLIDGVKKSYRFDYHDLYDEVENEYSWNSVYKVNTQHWDSTFSDRNEYLDWHDVSTPESITEPESSNTAVLSIAPNPVSGTVTISATAEIAQLQIYDIVGRLVSSQSPENRQVVFDTGVLPKGIYLVQARLKDGGVQIGKVVVK